MGGSSGSSKSSSKPTLLPEQQLMWRQQMATLGPQAAGKETYLTQLMAQRARDEGAKLQGQGMQNIQTAAGQTDMGSSDIASMVKAMNEQALQETFKQINTQRQATMLNAQQMLAGLPLAPGQTSKGSSKQKEGHII